MTERRSSADLGPNVEAALGSFPFPERDWEGDARAVEARLTVSTHGSTDSQLLGAPLPVEPDEPSGMSASVTPLTSSGVRTQSLAEMARRSVEKKQDSTREMARESLAIAARQRPNEARRVREPAHGEPAPVSAPAAVSRISEVSAAAAPTLVAAVAPQRLSQIALALPLLALAAAAALLLQRPEPTPLVTAPLPVAQSNAKPSAAGPAAAAAKGAIPSAPRGIDPSTLPDEPTLKAAEVALAHPKSAVASAAHAASAAQKIELEDELPAQVAVVPAVPDKPVEKSLPPDPALRPADSSGGELAAKPSSGAVQAALGAVMSGARRCVAGEDAPSSAVVVFASDGRVQHVSVSGPAAGQASGACIEAQLGHARVQPFAASAFSVSTTVRP